MSECWENETGDICLSCVLVSLGGSLGEELKCVEVLACLAPRGELGWQVVSCELIRLCWRITLVTPVSPVSNWILCICWNKEYVWVFINTVQLQGILWVFLSSSESVGSLVSGPPGERQGSSSMKAVLKILIPTSFHLDGPFQAREVKWVGGGLPKRQRNLPDSHFLCLARY